MRTLTQHWWSETDFRFFGAICHQSLVRNISPVHFLNQGPLLGSQSWFHESRGRMLWLCSFAEILSRGADVVVLLAWLECPEIAWCRKDRCYIVCWSILWYFTTFLQWTGSQWTVRIHSGTLCRNIGKILATCLGPGKATPHINLSEDIYLGFNVPSWEREWLWQELQHKVVYALPRWKTVGKSPTTLTSWSGRRDVRHTLTDLGPVGTITRWKDEITQSMGIISYCSRM